MSRAVSAVSTLTQAVRDRLDPDGAKARAEERRQQEARAVERRLDLRWMLGDVRGRRILANLLTRCHLMSSTYHPDQRLGDQAEGRRQLGLLIFGELVGAQPEEALALFKQDPAWERALEAVKTKDAGKT